MSNSDFRADGALSTSAPKVKPRLLADVLWEAANEHLWDGSDFGEGQPYSCWAIENALGTRKWLGDEYPDTAAFLKSLGCEIKRADIRFRTANDQERQGRRYMWLLLAMHVAEDEGITL